MSTLSPSRWAELFDNALGVIDQANAAGIGMDDWTFGGGTALMLQISHRESHDVDIFISDPQYLPFLNPQTQDYGLNLVCGDYESDGTRTLKLIFDGVGEIDFICCGSLTDAPFEMVDVRGRSVRLETPAEIIAKKIVYRGSRLQPRDIFDIAAVIQELGPGELEGRLSEHYARFS